MPPETLALLERHFVLIDSRWLLRAEARRPIRPHHRIVAKAIIEIAQTGEQSVRAAFTRLTAAPESEARATP